MQPVWGAGETVRLSGCGRGTLQDCLDLVGDRSAATDCEPVPTLRKGDTPVAP
jgi:hypothetical protein